MGTPYWLSESSYPEVRRRMLRGGPSGKDSSFAHQMLAAIGTQPDAFLLTANSAVPVADSIRGFYEAINDEPPIIDYIYAHRGEQLCSPNMRAEKLRLRSILRDAESKIYVIDEFVYTGNTLRKAHSLLQSIGIEPEAIGDIEGDWYENAHIDDVDLPGVTSSHRKVMYDIGREACQHVT